MALPGTKFPSHADGVVTACTYGGLGGDPGAFLSVLARHGWPIDVKKSGNFADVWRADQDGDPVADLAVLGNGVRRGWPSAFAEGGSPLPATQLFWHAVAGLTMLADWIGSDPTQFCLANGRCDDGLAWARAKAPAVLQALGFDPAEARHWLSAPPFKLVSPWPARPAQLVVGSADALIRR